MSPASKIRRVRKRHERLAEARTKLKRRVEDFRKKPIGMESSEVEIDDKQTG